MPRDGGWLDEGRGLERQLIRNQQEVAGRDGDELGEGTVATRADERVGDAGGEASGTALRADVTRDQRDNRGVAPAQALIDAWADRRHDAGRLVAEDHRIRPVPPQVAVEIRSAHRARAHFQQHLANPGHRVRDLAIAELTLALEDSGPHRDTAASRSNVGSSPRDSSWYSSNTSR